MWNEKIVTSALKNSISFLKEMKVDKVFFEELVSFASKKDLAERYTVTFIYPVVRETGVEYCDVEINKYVLGEKKFELRISEDEVTYSKKDYPMAKISMNLQNVNFHQFRLENVMAAFKFLDEMKDYAYNGLEIILKALENLKVPFENLENATVSNCLKIEKRCVTSYSECSLSGYKLSYSEYITKYWGDSVNLEKTNTDGKITLSLAGTVDEVKSMEPAKAVEKPLAEMASMHDFINEFNKLHQNSGAEYSYEKIKALVKARVERRVTN